ncbi:MAG TPA: hypothetical protein VIS29_16770 [Streptomyces sp.]
MPDRRRTAFRLPLPESASMRASTLMRERQSSSQGSSSSSPSGSPSASDNPFATPPADRPDQPWQPRHPSHRSDGDGEGDSQNNGGGDGPSDDRPAWGSQWSDRQPGRQNGGFGSRPGSTGGAGGNGAPGGGRKGTDRGPGGMRWDPTDPAQRRARYSVLGGMWAFFFAVFNFPEVALLLGALAVYWSISALRAKPKSGSSKDADASAQITGRATTAQITGAAGTGATGTGAAPTPGAGTGSGSRQQTTAAVSGLVTALLALSIVATTFTVQLVYRDYYTCLNDALTNTGALACNDELPKPLRPFFGVKN